MQISAAGTGTADLKCDFRLDLVLWGGGFDTQGVLGRGTPNDVRAEACGRVADLAPSGGLVFAAVHDIQANVPPENVAEMWEAVAAGGYRQPVGAEAVDGYPTGSGAAA